MKAMILAAGFGTRFRPVTNTLPKPLVPLCNRPLIGYAIESLLRANVRELIINLHHLPEALERFLTARYGNAAQLHFSYEPEILGTGGGIRKVRSLLERDDDFLLVNADTIQFPRYDDLFRARREHDALAALTLRHPPPNDRFTPVWLDDGRVTGFGDGSGEALMFSGAHAISSRIFDHLPDRDFSGIVDDVYKPLLASGSEAIAGVVDDGPWFDVGTPRRYASAFREILHLTLRREIELASGSHIEHDSIIDDRATIRGDVERATIGAASTIEGTVLESAVWDDCYIASGVVLRGCIVAHGVSLHEPRIYENVLLAGRDAIDIG